MTEELAIAYLNVVILAVKNLLAIFEDCVTIMRRGEK